MRVSRKWKCRRAAHTDSMVQALQVHAVPICPPSSLRPRSSCFLTSGPPSRLQMPAEATVVRATTLADLLLVRLIVAGATHLNT
jgi:hypothetical protein